MNPTCTADGYSVSVCKGCGAELSSRQKKDKLGHNWGSWETDKDSTCAATGSKHRVCQRCGDKQSETIAKKAHTWGNWVTDTDSTCSAVGSKHRVCTKCSERENGTIEKKNHTNSGQQKKVPATCTTDGYTVSVCAKCGAELGQRTTIKAAHTWGDWKVDKNATCTATGSKSRSCSKCGEKETDTIKELGHLVEGQLKTVPATCTKDGYKVIVCSRCGVEQGKREVIKAGHSWNKWVVQNEAGCETAGTKYRTCKNCSAKEMTSIPKLDHLVNGQVKTVPATCVKDGYQVVVCSRCGKEQGEGKVLKALGHSMGKWEIDKDAGCETAGTKHRTCTRKGCNYREDGTIDPKGHSFNGQRKVVPATCTKDGYSVVKCSNCSQEAQGRTILPALGHDWGAWNFNHDETCEKDGTKYRFCKRCGEREDGTVPHKVHTVSSQPKVVAATCVKDGYRVMVCSNCGKDMSERTILPKTGIHSFGVWVTSKDAGCEEVGEKYRKCVNCTEKEYDTIKELGHLVLGQRHTYIPEAGGEGYTVVVCSRCGKEMSNKLVFDVPVPEVTVEFHLSDKHGEAIIDPLVVVCLYKQKMGKVFPKVINPKQYTITAWRDGNGKQYDENTILNSTQKLDLYPVWGNAGEYTIFFVGNGATSNEIKFRIVPYDKEFTLPLAKELFDDGVGFEGWGTAPDGGDQWFDDGCTKENFAGKETSITLYALWNSDCTVTYFDIARYRVVDTDTLSHVYKVKGVRDYPEIQLDKLTFKGWQRKDKRIQVIYAKEGDSCLADGKDWILLPVYTVNESGKYAVVYHDTGRSNEVVVRTYTGLSIELEKVFPVYDSYHYLAGWTIRDELSGEPTSDAIISSLDTSSSYFYGTSIVFVDAVWKRYPEELRLYYGYDNLMDVIIVEEDDYKLPVPAERKGYIFAGWAEDPSDRSTIVGDCYNVPKYGAKLYAIWDTVKYSVKYCDGITGELIGATETALAGDKLRESAPEIPGMTFLGWTDGKQDTFSESETQWTMQQLGSNQFFWTDTLVGDLPFSGRQITLYSYYVQKNGSSGQTNVIFHPGQGKTALEPQMYQKSGKLTIPDTTDQKTGCVFRGWEWINRPGGAIVYGVGDEIDITVTPGKETTVILVARWQAQNAIVLNPNYPGAKKIDLSNQYFGGMNVSTAQLGEIVGDRPGYTLVAWEASQKYHSQRYGLLDNIYIPLNTDFTFTAIWKEKGYRIYYCISSKEYGGNDYIGLKTDLIYGKTKLNFDESFLRNFEVEGSIFIGWSKEKPIGSSTVDSSKIITAKNNSEFDLSDDLYVYACYEDYDSTTADKTTIKVIYDCLGGTEGPTPSEFTVKTTEFKLTTVAPKKEGYFFECWKSRDGFVIDNDNYESFIMNGTLLLYASWKPKVRNVMMGEFQGIYGREIMPDYMFLTEYETTEWRKIDDFCYFAIKTIQLNNDEYFKEMDSIVLVVQYKDGGWELTGRSSSQNWRKQLEYEILTEYTDDSTAAGGKFIFEMSVSLLNKHPMLKYLVKGADIVSFWREVEACCEQNLPVDDVTGKVSAKVLDMLYKVLKDELKDEDIVTTLMFKLAPDIDKTVRKCIKDNKTVVANGVGLIGKALTTVLSNPDSLIAILEDTENAMDKAIADDIIKALNNYSELEHSKVYTKVIGFSFEVFKQILSSITDSINFNKYVNLGVDPFGEMSVRLKTFYDQISGLGFDPNIKGTFFTVVEKIYKAYCFAK